MNSGKPPLCVWLYKRNNKTKNAFILQIVLNYTLRMLYEFPVLSKSRCLIIHYIGIINFCYIQ